MKDILEEFLQVKKIIAIIVTISLVILTFKGRVTAEQFIPIATVIVGYYFGQSTANDSVKTHVRLKKEDIQQ